MRPRAILLALALTVLPLAGCLADDGSDPGTDGEDGTFRPPSGGDPPASACPHLEMVVDEADGFLPGERVQVQVTLVNCTNATITPSLPFCAKPGSLTPTVLVDGDEWFLASGPAEPEPRDGGCDVFERDIPAGESFPIPFHWDGRLATSGCDAMRCAADAWAPPGEYEVRATLVSDEGESWSAWTVLSFLAPELPPYSNDGEVVLLLDEEYPEGGTVQVRVRNDGDRTFAFSEYYPACANLRFFNETGYPFIVPEGTHCDIANEDTLEPGETVVLFAWGLDECVVDQWGCAESRPLPPGRYHVAGSFHEDVERYWEKPETRTQAGATIRVVAG